MKEYIFHIHGMHCASCVGLIESELGELPSIETAKADLGTRTLRVCGGFENESSEAVAAHLNAVLERHGYRLAMEEERKAIRWREFLVAGPIALVFVGLFLLLQKLGIVNLISAGEMTYGTAFFIGIVASVSTCMAVVGGLVLSMSANFAKEGNKIKPQILFHVGRISAFFLLGGLLSALGSFVQFGRWGTFSLTAIVGAVMLLLGINLLDIFPWAKKLQPTLPNFISRHMNELKKANHTFVPFALGALTFFLPCGFTQSMQLYALSLGDFFAGSATMLAFALGTFPVLALLSFASVGIHDTLKSGIFFKAAGIIVIFFALFNLANSLVIAGIIRPFFNL